MTFAKPFPPAKTPHHLTRVLAVVISVLTLASGLRAAGAKADGTVFFESKIRPLLIEHCLKCHSTETKQKGGLLLDSRLGWEKGGDSGPAIIPGDPEHSLLIKAVRHTDRDLLMPPKNKLSDAEIVALTQWVSMGAPDPREKPALASAKAKSERAKPDGSKHWAFQPPVNPPVPVVRGVDRVRTPVDAFLLARLEKASLGFSPEADRATLLRRVTMDLTALPPMEAELAAFASADDADAYDQVIERLLNSPQFGVRWGQYWLDVAGYTDTVSFDEDFGPPIGLIDDKWRYRDYVVDSLNRDKPYDRFLVEQLAGDELVTWRDAKTYTPEILEKLVATGFLRTVQDITVEDPRPFVIWSVVHETLEQVGESVMGLTLQCARCHDHKFEPIPQDQYYSLMALFTPALNPAQWKNAKNRLLPDAAGPLLAEIQKHNEEIDRQMVPQQKEIDAIRLAVSRRVQAPKLEKIPEVVRADLLAALEVPAAKQDAVQKYLAAKLGPLIKGQPAEIDAALTAEEKAKLKLHGEEIARANLRKRKHGWIHALYDVGPAPATFVLNRGEFERPGREVSPGFLDLFPRAQPAAAFGSSTGPAGGRRLALAKWLTEADSPASALVARVMVNRIWQQMFGRGLVLSSGNLGLSGARPTHPELLEWLVSDFRAHGWSLKHLIRRMATSSAYRQQSGEVSPGTLETAAAATAADPENELLWRMNHRRIDAEALRDAILSQSGRLDPQLGGPPMPLVYEMSSGSVSEPALTEQNPKARRSLYLLQRRLYNPSFLATFDKPTVTRGIAQRDPSATVLQSLTLLNDRFLVENAERCARLLAGTAGTGTSGRIEAAYWRVLSRPPDGQEKAWCGEFLNEQTVLHERSGLPPEEASLKSLAALCQVLWGSNEFLYLP